MDSTFVALCVFNTIELAIVLALLLKEFKPKDE